MGSVTAVAVVECSRIGAFGDPTWSAEQRGAAHAQLLCVRRNKRFYGRVVGPRSCLEKKPSAGIMRLPPVPHEAAGSFLGFIGGAAPHSCRVVDLYPAMHGDGDVR
ncbi:retrotransposon hot spot protein (RHS) [Trypanosoma cruzi]|nr:retrotransposon hot spot protein (RHS) [Trypanosoma cruzi]